jgi:hypothetical protein
MTNSSFISVSYVLACFNLLTLNYHQCLFRLRWCLPAGSWCWAAVLSVCAWMQQLRRVPPEYKIYINFTGHRSLIMKCIIHDWLSCYITCKNTTLVKFDVFATQTSDNLTTSIAWFCALWKDFVLSLTLMKQLKYSLLVCLVESVSNFFIYICY